MVAEIACPVRRETTGAAPLTEPKRALQVAEFDAKACECRAGVDNEATAVAGSVPTLVGISDLLKRTVDADGRRHEIVLSPRPGFAESYVRWRLAEPTAGECLLHRVYASSSQAAVHPRWKTASWVIESNASPLGS